jgi:hypothetical protein
MVLFVDTHETEISQSHVCAEEHAYRICIMHVNMYPYR